MKKINGIEFGKLVFVSPENLLTSPPENRT